MTSAQEHGEHALVPTSTPVADGPTYHGVDPSQPFTARQLTRIDGALTLGSRECGLPFSLYVGELNQPSRAHAEELFTQLTEDSVLIAISPGQRLLHIVTGAQSAERLPNRACALAALAMRTSFASGDLVGGIVTGLRMLTDAAGSPHP